MATPYTILNADDTYTYDVLTDYIIDISTNKTSTLSTNEKEVFQVIQDSSQNRLTDLSLRTRFSAGVDCRMNYGIQNVGYYIPSITLDLTTDGSVQNIDYKSPSDNPLNSFGNPNTSYTLGKHCYYIKKRHTGNSGGNSLKFSFAGYFYFDESTDNDAMIFFNNYLTCCFTL